MSFWSLKEEDAREQTARRIDSFGSQAYPSASTTTDTPASEPAAAAFEADAPIDEFAREATDTVVPDSDYIVSQPRDESSSADSDPAAFGGLAAVVPPGLDEPGDVADALRVALKHVLDDEAAKAARIAELRSEIDHLSARRDEATSLALTIQQYLADNTDA